MTPNEYFLEDPTSIEAPPQQRVVIRYVPIKQVNTESTNTNWIPYIVLALFGVVGIVAIVALVKGK